MWEHYSVASKVNKEEGDVQVAALLTAIGPEARKVFKTWNLPATERKDIKGVIERSTTTAIRERIFPSSAIFLICGSKSLANRLIAM